MARLFCWLIAVITAVCSIPAMAAEPIRIGVSLGLTGSYGLTSNKHKNAYMLFAEDINAAGGILGRQVEFVIRDNGSEAAKAAAQYEELITVDKVDFVLGPYTSGLTMAIAPVVEKYGYPTLAAGAAADTIWQQGYSNIFGMWTPASRYVLGFLKLLTANQLDRLVIVTGDGAFATDLSQGVSKWAQALELEVLETIVFAEGTTDFSAIAERVREANPTVLICTGHYYVGASMKRALLDIGYQPPVFYATVSPTFQKYHDDFGDDAELDLSTSIWELHPRLVYPGAQEFARRYQERFGEPPTYQAASAYGAGQVLAKAIASAGSMERGAVRSALQRLKTTSVIGRYAVDRTGMQIKRVPLIVQWQDGQKEIVWPKELQTRPARFKEIK